MLDSGYALIPGILDADESGRVPPFTCEVAKGGALVIRPLLLHASAPATEPRHRRVIHIDYANSPLPGGLEWFEENAP